MKNCDLRMNRCPTAGAEGEGMFSGVEPDVGAREEEGRQEVDPELGGRLQVGQAWIFQGMQR